MTIPILSISNNYIYIALSLCILIILLLEYILIYLSILVSIALTANSDLPFQGQYDVEFIISICVYSMTRGLMKFIFAEVTWLQNTSFGGN